MLLQSLINGSTIIKKKRIFEDVKYFHEYIESIERCLFG